MKEKIEEKLKPCPFCGSDLVSAHAGYVECLNCRTFGPSKTDFEPMSERRLWNTRHDAK